jgi:hypothetical protein
MIFKIGSEIFVLQFSIGDHSRPKNFFFSCSILFGLNIVKISCVHPRPKCNNLKKLQLLFILWTLSIKNKIHWTQSEMRSSFIKLEKDVHKKKSFHKNENLFLSLRFITFENKPIDLRGKNNTSN